MNAKREMNETEQIYPTKCHANISFAKIDLLYENGLILWPNFTNCLPNCGICQLVTVDATYNLYNLILIGSILPLIGFGGLIGNSISAYIYSRKEMRSSTNSYLCALGCSDCAVICTAIFLFCIDSIKRHSLYLSIIYGFLTPFIHTAGMAAQTISVYFTLAAGADCFVQVCLHDHIRKCLSRRVVVRFVIVLIIVFGTLYNLPHCFEALALECWHTNFQSPSLEVCPHPFRFLPIYTLIYYKYMYSIFLAIGPLILLVILNLSIILATMLDYSEGSNSGDTTALVLVVLMFIICNTAALLINIFESHIAESLGHSINYVIDASNLLVVLNSSVNFIIYVTFSDSFRRTLEQYVRLCRTKYSCARTVMTSRKNRHNDNRNDSNDGMKQNACIPMKFVQPEQLI